jgi:hypothetical protein
VVVGGQGEFAGRDQVILMRAVLDFIVQEIDENGE